MLCAESVDKIPVRSVGQIAAPAVMKWNYSYSSLVEQVCVDHRHLPSVGASY